jgi:hypothetical protein
VAKVTEHHPFLVWDSVTGKWAVLCRGCPWSIKPTTHEVASKKRDAHAKV